MSLSSFVSKNFEFVFGFFIIMLIVGIIGGMGMWAFKHMTTEEIIVAIKKCEYAGLQAEAQQNIIGKVYGINCVPVQIFKPSTME